MNSIIIHAGGVEFKVACQKFSAEETEMCSPDTTVQFQSNQHVSLAARAWRLGLKMDCLRVVACRLINGTTRDSTLENLATMSQDGSYRISNSTYDANANLIWEILQMRTGTA